ncbi:YeaH/YhbH family protein [Aestuariirhabdus sp. Z084]|uniref:YeaH/YhbH family protein n=1 Tax=Aestuariirhabdus haliotis TaxID=2918751 RepID=UPI00201B4611|nr:YeaH/YhbH family protein [Aestuariirhabdus haliotis]MCL6414339.1 YeaH/YhbH family protein [Aestuariirhabdus haliotis]MCL6418271.1 YeaH/YhbH family protein [Aestuariirhabdus haliotis]
MSHIIDRRLNAKNKSTVNRQRFLERYKKHIKKAVAGAVNQRSITDVEHGSDITIPRKDMSEPVFHHGSGGDVTTVHPGNKEFVAGDHIKRPLGGGGGSGGGSGDASNEGEGLDDFTFHISQEEFLEFMFEDLELPFLVKKQLKDALTFDLHQAGFSNKGTPEKLNIVRSLRSAHARRIALSGKERREIRALKRELRQLELAGEEDNSPQVLSLKEQIKVLNERLKRLPFIDEFDLKFNNYVRVPRPSTKAVMLCLMDVSGSMTQEIKDMAKRFFLLLYLFLQRNYKQIEVVFIRHHTSAKEVDEEDFFYSRETGGTIVSSALELGYKVIQQRYPSADWNVYVAQASDGDNWEGDSSVCTKILTEHLLPLVQYFAYVEITDRHHQNLWREYEDIQEENSDSFAMQQIKTAADIYPVFRKLFERKPA